jgi:hypothetical protein
MGLFALELLQEMREIPGSGIATQRRIVQVDVDHSWDHMLPQADEVYALWKATDKPTDKATDKPTDKATEPAKKGCGSIIGTTAVVMTAVLGLGVTVILKKKD